MQNCAIADCIWPPEDSQEFFSFLSQSCMIAQRNVSSLFSSYSIIFSLGIRIINQFTFHLK